MSNRRRISRRQFMVASGSAALLAACRQQAATTAEPTQPTEVPPTAVPVTEATQDISNRNLEQIERLSDTKISMDGFHGPIMSGRPEIQGFADQMFDKKMEELTNVHVEWQAAADWGRQPLELLVASGDIPALVAGWFDISADLSDFGMKGAFAPLNDLIAANPYLSTLLQKNPKIRGQITAADGNIYVLPAIVEKPRQIEFGYWVRKDWLDEAGLDVPDTVDEWYEVMKAFRARGDEVHPYSLAPEWIIWLYGVGHVNRTYGTSFYHDKGEVKFGPLQPQWREALQFIAKLYEEQIIPSDYLEILGEPQGIDRVMADGIAGTGVAGNWEIAFVEKNAPDVEIIGMPAPAGPYGHREMLANWYDIIPLTGTSIGSTSDQQELAARYYDLYYSDSGSALYFWGVYGDTYIEEDGKRKFTEKVTNDPEMGVWEYQWSVISPNWLGGYYSTGDDYIEAQTPMTRAAQLLWIDQVQQTIQLPTLFYTEDEKDILNSVVPDLNTLVGENTAKFIDGSQNLEADYEATIDDINSLPMDDITAIYQAAYERFLDAVDA